MHLSPVGISKLCFLLSLALCAFLMLLIPTLQAPARQGDLPPPLPRPQLRPKPAGARRGLGAEVLPPGGAHPNKTTLGQRVTLATSPQTPNERTAAELRSLQGAEDAAAQRRYLGSRSRDPLEPKDIFLAIKTTKKYHKSRLELLFQTWISRAKEQVRRH